MYSSKMFNILNIFMLLFLVFVKGVSLVKTSFDLGSKSGFCVDIESVGSSIFYDSVLLSSCKLEDKSENALQQMLFEGVGHITIDGYQRCLEVKPKSGGWDLVFRPCWSKLQAQNFTLKQEGCKIMNEKSQQCLAAGATLSSGGDELTRLLQVVDCRSVSGKWLSWDVHPSSYHHTKLRCSKPSVAWSWTKWAMIIFVVFGLITCWCGCSILFCGPLCRQNQKQTGLMIWRGPSTKIPSDHTIPSATRGDHWFLTPENKEMIVVRSSAVSYNQILRNKPVFKPASLKQKTTASWNENKHTPEASLYTHISKNIFRMEEELPRVEENVGSFIQTWDHILADKDVIHSEGTIKREKNWHGTAHRGYSSPSDYRYSPFRRQKSGRYMGWSDYLFSTQSEDIEYSPMKRP